MICWPPGDRRLSIQQRNQGRNPKNQGGSGIPDKVEFKVERGRRQEQCKIFTSPEGIKWNKENTIISSVFSHVIKTSSEPPL